MRPTARLAGLVLAVLAVVATACVEAEHAQRQPEVVDDGLQATGRIGGSRVAVSSGNPEVTLGDCDPRDGPDEDLCVVARTIDGATIALVIENPGVLEPDGTVAVRADPCEAAACDEVDDRAVVMIRLGQRQIEATGGRLIVEEAGDRYAVAFDVSLSGGDQLVGGFNVRPGAG